MKTPNIKCYLNDMLNNINCIRKFRTAQKQIKIDKLVNIDNVHQKETYKTLSEAKELIANYAASKGVKVRFHSFPEEKVSEQMKNQMYLWVSKGYEHQGRIIPTDIARTYAKETEKLAILEKQNGDAYLTKGKFLVEDSFLRNVYRNIEELAGYFTKKK